MGNNYSIYMLVPLAMFAALLGTGVLTPLLIPMLKRLKFGQSIREDGPTWHSGKKGTPTMGGIAMIGGTFLPVMFAYINYGDELLLISYLMALSFGFIGFIDDYIKVVKKRNLGLKSKQKIVLQLIACATYLFSVDMVSNVSTSFIVPYFGVVIELGLLYYIAVIFIIIGTVNSVNLTDGVDALVTSVSMPVAIFFMAAALFLSFNGLAIYAATLLGALVGFFIYNKYPAKVFMGDTGSFFLGGYVVSMAFLLDMPLILVICGIIYVVEAVSDIIQVGYFKLTKGKRFFKMAPLHHHFEMIGWDEKKIVKVFSAISVVASALSYVMVINTFN